MSLPIAEIMLRLVEIQKEAMAAIGLTQYDAVPYFNHVQDDFPYWTNRLGPIDFESEIEDFEDDTYTFVMRLVVGHLTEGYDGEIETLLNAWIPVIALYFNQREWLNTETSYPDATEYLKEARVTNSPGFRIFPDSGIGATQIGTEFMLTCKFNEDLEQAYT